MKFTSPTRLLGRALLLALLPPACSAVNLLRSTSLATCMDNSGFSATLFNVSFTPDNGQLMIQINGESTIVGNVKAKVTVLAYGFPVFTETLDPCSTSGLDALCPMQAQPLDLNFQQTIPASTVAQIPVIAYKIPDLDGIARMEVLNSTGQTVACVEAPLANGKTVEQPAVGWVTAAISAVALLASAVLSGTGHAMTSAHIAANVLSVFSYFQAQAFFAMMAVPLPPLAIAWAQNYDWAVGIIRLDFMQTIFHWYIAATGGTPANLFKQQQTVSVQIAKRSINDLATRAARYGFTSIAKRTNNEALISNQEVIKVTGIARMSYKAHIESTNFFLTGMSFFVAFICLVMILVGGFRLVCTLPSVKKSGRFPEFRAKWLVVFKGIMYRIVLIGFPQMAVLCPWEWTHVDSSAVAVLSVFFALSMLGTLGWGCYKILTIPRKASGTAGNPAYSLYRDPQQLNRWGYLYVPFRPERYWYIIVILIYSLAKGITIAFAQHAGVAQSLVIMVIEFFNLVAVCYLTPWLDRRTNMVNIAIAVVGSINSILAMVFSGVTNAQPMVIGIMGVIFFIVNAVFALILLCLLLASVGYAIFSKNPEARYRGAYELHVQMEEKRELRDLDAEPRAVEEGEGEGEGEGVSRVSRDESERAVALGAVPRVAEYEAAGGNRQQPGEQWNRGVGFERSGMGGI